MVVPALVIKYFQITFLPPPSLSGAWTTQTQCQPVNYKLSELSPGEVSDRKITKLPFTFSLEVNLLMKLRVIFVKVRNSRLEILSFHL